jgi:hypothetical protein
VPGVTPYLWLLYGIQKVNASSTPLAKGHTEKLEIAHKMKKADRPLTEIAEITGKGTDTGDLCQLNECVKVFSQNRKNLWVFDTFKTNEDEFNHRGSQRGGGVTVTSGRCLSPCAAWVILPRFHGFCNLFIQFLLMLLLFRQPR